MYPQGRRAILILLICLLITAACTPTSPETTTPLATLDSPAAPITPAIANTEPQTLTVLYTNDEHGWMAGEEKHGGAASMMYLWNTEEGYAEAGPYLIVSGGDTWTGPAISSWFDGESMVEVMNEMGYATAAIGNHEFDYGIEGLELRTAQAVFPYLSANIQMHGSGTRPDFAIPYSIQNVNGLSVGIIGLSTLSTPKTTMPTYVANLDFSPYATTLKEIVPQVKAQGAKVIIVTAHICSYELLALAPRAAELGVAMIGGGHCHERFSQVVGGVALVEAGSNLRAYGRVDITYDPTTTSVTDVKVEVKSNNNDGQDAEIAALVNTWQVAIDAELEHVIGYTIKSIPQSSTTMFNMVMDAWLAAYPADVALSNPGGFRQGLSKGDITLADVVGVLPFDNYLIDVELTGAQLISSVKLGSRSPAIGGMSTQRGYWLADGSPIDPSATYHVLVNNYMYAGGDGYKFAEYDPHAYETGIDWRQPIIDWIIDQKSDQDNPLDSVIDSAQR